MESPQRSVKVVEVCRISPLPDRSDSVSPESLPLTFFDIVWLRFPPVTRLFFYELTETDSFYDSIVPRLKNSLSLSLSHYLPLAGHLVWPQNSPKPVIHYLAGDGVSFTVAESDGLDFDALSGDSFFRGASECRPLIPKLATSHDRSEAVAIQVTLFPGSGFCLGVISHHAVLDGKSSTSFAKTWAKICRSSLRESPEVIDGLPFYDRTAVEDLARPLEATLVDAWLNDEGPNNRSVKIWEFAPLPPDSVRGTFAMTRETIGRLRKSLNDPAVSTFSLVSGYASVCYAKATRAAREDQSGVTTLGFAADLRARLRPALPAEYFGNCLGWRSAVVETELLLGDTGVISSAEAIHKAVKSLDCENVLAGAEKYASIIQEVKARLNSRSDVKGSVLVSGSPRFDVYGADFGFGRPKKVEMVPVNRTRGFYLSDSKNCHGGVELGLVLNRNQMEAFAFEFLNGLENL